ncbi:MAG: hypothetical protein LBE35_09820 [Clostridiales bacterium]|nr:hypothetical protein [Clostridiales bacterium]
MGFILEQFGIFAIKIIAVIPAKAGIPCGQLGNRGGCRVKPGMTETPASLSAKRKPMTRGRKPSFP